MNTIIENTTNTNEERDGFAAKMPIELDMPEGYSISKDGIFLEHKEERELICHNPILITRRFVSETTFNEKFEISFYKDGSWKAFSVARSDVSRTVSIINTLGDKGCSVTQRNAAKIIDYLQELENKNLAKIPLVRSVESCGWVDDYKFVPFMAPGYEFDYTQIKPEYVQGLSRKGSLSGWVNDMRPNRANSTFRFILSAGLAAPLLDIVEMRSFIVYNWATSGSGKTAAVHAAMSAWGNPEKLVCTFNATSVGLERQASFFKDIPLGLDERQSAGKGSDVQNSLERIIYMLANGTGRVRGEKTGGIQTTKTWKTVVLSTGEEPIVVSSTQDGVVNRCVELERAPFDSSKDASAMYIKAQSNYGYAAYEFIAAVLKLGREKVREIYRAIYSEIQNSGVSENRSHIAYIAVTATADYILSRSLFADSEESAWNAAIEMANSVAKQNAINSKRDVNREAVNSIVEWVAENKSAFDGFSDDVNKYRSYGFYIESSDEMCCYPNVLSRMLESLGYSSGKTLRYMKEHNLINAESGKNTIKRAHNGDKLRVVSLNWKLLTEDDDSAKKSPATAPVKVPVAGGCVAVETEDCGDELPFPEE